MRNLNRIVLTGGLTRDPELRRTPAGTPVAALRLGYTTQRKQNGQWQEHSNYIDVELWGSRAEAAARYLRKGRQVAIDGRLEWREFHTRAGERRQVHTVIADTLEYLPDGHRSESDPTDGAFHPEPVGVASDDEILF